MSDNISDLVAFRNQREQPDPEHVRQDSFGRPLYRYVLSYQYGDDDYCTDVWAYDAADAEARVSAMRASLKVDGQVYASF